MGNQVDGVISTMAFCPAFNLDEARLIIADLFNLESRADDIGQGLMISDSDIKENRLLHTDATFQVG